MKYRLRHVYAQKDILVTLYIKIDILNRQKLYAFVCTCVTHNSIVDELPERNPTPCMQSQVSATPPRSHLKVLCKINDRNLRRKLRHVVYFLHFFFIPHIFCWNLQRIRLHHFLNIWYWLRWSKNGCFIYVDTHL